MSEIHVQEGHREPPAMTAIPAAAAAAAAVRGSIPLVAMPVPPDPSIPRVHPKTGAPILQDPFGVLYSVPPPVKAEEAKPVSVGEDPHVAAPVSSSKGPQNKPRPHDKPPEGRNGERDAVSALLGLSSSGVSKARKLKRDTVSLKGQGGLKEPGKAANYRPETFCLDPMHITREGTHPRKRDCSKCNAGKLRRKNLCKHHKVGCTIEGCQGCLRRDRCLQCNACCCEVNKKLLQECELCSGLFCEHGVHKWNRAKAKCTCWQQVAPRNGHSAAAAAVAALTGLQPPPPPPQQGHVPTAAAAAPTVAAPAAAASAPVELQLAPPPPPPTGVLVSKDEVLGE